jgi:hypothetical protein
MVVIWKNSKLILIAGPYRSGTNDDPELIHVNVKAMTDMVSAGRERGNTIFFDKFEIPLVFKKS